MLKAVTRQATSVDSKIRALNADPSAMAGRQNPISTANFFDHYATADDIAVMVTEQDFLEAHKELIPSVSAGELQHYETVRAMFEGTKDKKAIEQPQPQTNGHGAMHQEQLAVRPASRSKSKDKGKGKGKAVATGSDGEDDGDDRFASYGGGSGGSDGANGAGKGKSVAKFQNGTASDDEGLY